MDDIKENFETVYIVTAPFSGQEEEICDNNFITEDVTCVRQGENSLNDKSSIESNEDNGILDNKCDASDKDLLTRDMPQNVAGTKLEELSEKSMNKKKRGRPKTIRVVEKPVPIIPEGVEVDDNTCLYCLKVFKKPGNKKQHMRQIHNVASRTNGYIRCNECNLEFLQVNKLRQHLDQVHNLRMTVETLKFPNLEAFKVWKSNLERKDGEFFTQQYGPKKKHLGIKWGYVCHRSGKYRPHTKGPDRKRMSRNTGSYKMGIYCTAALSIEERANEVIVKHWPQHYGHLKDISTEQISSQEQCTLEESISSGVPLNDLLEDVRENVTSEKITQMALKKRDIKIIKTAFESDDFNPGMNDSESVDRWVGLCMQMDDSPVLCYRQEELEDGTDDFLLVIMTEFQKQLLVSSEKKVVCVDCVHRRKGGRFYLTCISIMDECDVAFPVAFCISNKIEASVVKQFLLTVKESTGPLSCSYFMSENENFYFDAWKEIMNDNSNWLWSMWYIDYTIHLQLRYFKGQMEKKAEAYKTIMTLIECQSQTIFETMFQNYLDSLAADPTSRKFGDYLTRKYAPNAKYWAYCYRTDMKPTTNFQLDMLHRTLRYCCREGRKTRLDKFILVLMKYVKMKTLDRLGNILDDEKTSMAIDAINMCHNSGLDIQTERISSLSDKIWLIRSINEEEDVYVVRDFECCPERCMLRCGECDICVHMYSCSCMTSMINANLCQHIHAVVWKFLTPHFSPMASPSHDYEDDSQSNDTLLIEESHVLLKSVLKRTHGIYNKVRKCKWSLNKESLATIMNRLNELDECIDVCSGKKAPKPQEENSKMDDENSIQLNVEETPMKEESLPNSNAPVNPPPTFFFPNSIVEQKAQNCVSQQLAYQTVPQINVDGTTSQTLFLPNQPPIVLPPNKSQEPYILIVKHNTLSNNIIQK